MTAEDALKTGTTTIGIKLKDGVILASDQRATMSNLIAHSHVQKVYASVIRQGFYLGLIVGGYDRTGGHVFSIDGAGGYIEDDYMSVGSGSVFALGSLEGTFKKDMSKEEGIDVAITALNAARRRDNCTGDGMLVSYIGPDGYQEIPRDEIKSRCEALGFVFPN